MEEDLLEYSFISSIVVGLAYLVLSVRLYRLSVKTGKLPEWYLCLGCGWWAISYFAWYTPYVLGVESLVESCSYVGAVTSHFGTIAFALFFRVTFRPHERWANWLIGGVIALMVVGTGGSWWVGDFGFYLAGTNPFFGIYMVGYSASFVWMTIEAFIQFKQARKRQAIGLCEPIVANRYLLLGIAGLAWVIYRAIIVAQCFEYAQSEQWSTGVDQIRGGLEFLAAASFWLIFFPPQFYRRLFGVGGQSPAAQPQQG